MNYAKTLREALNDILDLHISGKITWEKKQELTNHALACKDMFKCPFGW